MTKWVFSYEEIDVALKMFAELQEKHGHDPNKWFISEELSGLERNNSALSWLDDDQSASKFSQNFDFLSKREEE